MRTENFFASPLFVGQRKKLKGKHFKSGFHHCVPFTFFHRSKTERGKMRRKIRMENAIKHCVSADSAKHKSKWKFSFFLWFIRQYFSASIMFSPFFLSLHDLNIEQQAGSKIRAHQVCGEARNKRNGKAIKLLKQISRRYKKKNYKVEGGETK